MTLRYGQLLVTHCKGDCIFNRFLGASARWRLLVIAISASLVSSNDSLLRFVYGALSSAGLGCEIKRSKELDSSSRTCGFCGSCSGFIVLPS